MALIPCSECGKQVSEKAASCPNCGAPITGAASLSLNPKSHAKVTRTRAKWEGMGFLLILVGMIMAIATKSTFSALLMAVGFIVFIIGRFK